MMFGVSAGVNQYKHYLLPTLVECEFPFCMVSLVMRQRGTPECVGIIFHLL
jgi:hypothetical protein